MKVQRMAASIYARIVSTRVDKLAEKCEFQRLGALLGEPFPKSREPELARCALLLLRLGQPQLSFKAVQSGADPFMNSHSHGDQSILFSLMRMGHWENALKFVELFSSGAHAAPWREFDQKFCCAALAAAAARCAQASVCSPEFPSGQDLPNGHAFQHACLFMKRIKEAGADINGMGVDGLRALHYAAGYPKSFDDPTCLSICGPRPPLPYAIPQLCMTLLSLGADANAPSNQGMKTPLMCAALSLSMESIQILLDAGADARAIDANGNSVAHYAAWGFRMAKEEGRGALLEQALELVCASGAPLRRANVDGQCPEDFVAEQNRSVALDLHCRRSRPALPEDVMLFGRVGAQHEGVMIAEGLSASFSSKRTLRM